MISVVMSTYNETAEELRGSINSILKQSYQDMEFIILNDNPERDDLKEILKFYGNSDTRISVIDNKKNMGLAASLNVGIREANGEYIARMDADDISLPHRLEKELDFLKRNGLDLASCFVVRMDEDGKELPADEQENAFTLTDAGSLLPIINFIKHPAVLGKTEVFRELNGYRALVPAEDYDLWLRMVSGGFRIGCMEERLLKYRVRRTGISKSNQYMQYITAGYARNLYKERRRQGYDSFSEEHFKKYLLKHGAYNKKRTDKYNETAKNYQAALKDVKNKRYGRCLRPALKTLFGGAAGPEMILTGLSIRFGRKRLIRKNM
ncbi:glycosyltransferase [Clostridiaceae bacterium]|nr:glycosyltransferase [Clostridium sp.]NBI71488.1 glycosyltransferase [Clostridiaceae bacterium]